MPQHYPFELLPLPYLYDSLEPAIDMETMYFHHDKHLRTYIEKLNQTLAPYPEYHDWTLERLLLHLDELPEEIREDVRKNAGGVFNHEFYFGGMNSSPTEPHGQLKEALLIDFGSYEAFLQQLMEKSMELFGSGYLWLVLNNQGRLSLIPTANQDTPLTKDVYPLLNIDLWEHAYYLKHQNLRANYVKNWISLINWAEVNHRYQQALLSILLQNAM